MYKYILLLLALFISTVYSTRTVSFKVISFGSKTQVRINNKTYRLKPYNDDEILYAGKISNAPDGEFQYQYIVDGVKESFNRTLSKSTKITNIEFFGRKDTVKKLKAFSYPNNNWNKSIGKTELFDDSYIPTIHITGSKVDNFFKHPEKGSVKFDKVTFYLKNTKKVANNVSASPKNHNFAKFQIKMRLNKSESIDGRYLFKLRNGGEDPLNMRQLIYGNIIYALGIPSIKSVMVRVYYNKKPAGFYTLQEDATSESFIRAEFNGNPSTKEINSSAEIGYLQDGTTGSDFEYHPDDLSFYGPFETQIGDKTRLVKFCGALSKLNTKKSKDIKNFEKQWFDIETFHKAMAMEYLTGDWDGYWYATSNFVVYDNPAESTSTTYKHYFITQDHDETWGVGLSSRHNKYGYDFPKVSYTTMLNKEWKTGPDDAVHRTLVDKLIASSPELQQRFENILISVVQNIFNPVAFKRVVDSYYNRYKPEMEWDFSFTREYKPSSSLSAGNPDYTFKDFKNNLNKGVGGLKWGLYEWVQLRAEAIKNEFCITWNGDANPPKKVY